MEDLKINLTTKFMKGIVNKLVSTIIAKKLGYDLDIRINELVITTDDDKIHLHANVDGEVSNDDFLKIIKSIGMEGAC